MHSPVWISYDPGLEFMDYESDWENSADEYYDVGSSKPKKRKASSEHESLQKESKRRKLERTQQIPDLKLDGSPPVRQPVVWKPLSQRLRSPELPLLKEGEAKKVALLKDWRKQFNITASQSTDVEPQTKSGKKSRNTSRRNRKLEPIEDDYDYTLDEEEEAGPSSELPPTSLVSIAEDPQMSKNRNRLASFMNGTSSTIAKQAMQQALTAKEQVSLPPDYRERLVPLEELPTQAIVEDMESSREEKAGQVKRGPGKDCESGNGKESTRGKRKAEDSVEEPPPKKKPAAGREKKAAEVTKSTPATTSVGRKTRSKK